MTYKSFPLGALCRIEKGLTGIMKAVPGPYTMVTLAENRTSHDEYQFDVKAVIVPLISSTGYGHASMKRVHYQEGKFALGSILCALIPNDEAELNPRFLYNFLSFFKDSLLVPLMRGAANVSLSIKSISGVVIPLPPLADQLTANELIDAYSQKVTDYQAELQTQQTLLTKLRQSILQEAVQGKLTERWRAERKGFEQADAGRVAGSNPAGGSTSKYETATNQPVTPGITGAGLVRTATGPDETGAELLTRIRAEKAELIRQGKLRKEKPLPPITDAEKPFVLPYGWAWCRLGEVEVGSDAGNSLQCHEYPVNGEEWGIIKVSAISWDKFQQNQNKFLSALTPNNISAKIKQGDFIISRANTTDLVGKSIVVDFISMNLLLSDKTIRFRFHNDIDSRFINLSNNSKQSRRFYSSVATGSSPSMKNITRDQMRSNLIPLPSLSEQQDIVARFEKALAQVSELEAENRQQQAEVGRLMQTVLREAFSGKEVVTN